MIRTPEWTVPQLGTSSDEHLQGVIDNKTKPPGSLGQLESLALQIARVQKLTSPHHKLDEINAEILVFAADHGIAKNSVSIAPAEVTQQMVKNFLAGGAAINCFCRSNDVSLKVIDAGMLAPITERQSNYFEYRVGDGTKDISVTAAMSVQELEEGLESGAEIVKTHLNADTNLIGFGEMGIGNTSSAAALLCSFTNKPACDVVGRGTGITDAQFEQKVKLVQSALDRTSSANDGQLPRPLYLLSSLGGFEIVQIVGAMLSAAEQRKLIVVDGFIVSVAALFACEIEPNVRQFLVFAHVGAERSHQLVLNELEAAPLLDLGLRLGEGTGAALAIPLIRAAVAFFNDMATFESANVNV